MLLHSNPHSRWPSPWPLAALPDRISSLILSLPVFSLSTRFSMLISAHKLPNLLLNSHSAIPAIRSIPISRRLSFSIAGMFLPELHVAQQSRRDKLRVPPPLPPSAAAFHHIYDASVFPPAFDLPSSAVAGCVSDSSPFFNQFEGGGGGGGGGGSGIWKGGDWVLHNGPNAPFLNASPQINAFESHRHLGDLHCASLPYFPYSLHDVVSSSSASLLTNHGLEIPSLDGANELLLLPSYAGSTTAAWTTGLPVNGSGKGEGVFCGAASSESTQGLVLSLSSNPPQRYASGDGGAIAEGGSQVGGLWGPFTGYATVLKCSKFLKPAQQLLDEFCILVTGSTSFKHCDAAGQSLADGNGEELSCGWGGAISAASSSSVHSSTEVGGDGSPGGPSWETHRPAFEQKKAKLLYIQEEICRRYKQYQQQMQFVVSSFESIAGLSSATPYTTLALKATSKHFRCLKNAISDQLRHVCRVLGDERMDSCPCSSKIDPSAGKQKLTDSRVGCSDKHPIWRPQRGLPERAVSVLRAWLFDNFLHPYPTDTDKHMLAMQTGLSRNQVSNWFINARVRLWKPMVEEIHTLETKGMSAMDLNSSNKKLSEAPSNKQTTGSSHGTERWHPEKKSRMENCDMDGGLMSFAYQGRMGIGALGAVSLTLGLRQDEGSQQNQKQRTRDLEHHILHDFVG